MADWECESSNCDYFECSNITWWRKFVTELLFLLGTGVLICVGGLALLCYAKFSQSRESYSAGRDRLLH